MTNTTSILRVYMFENINFHYHTFTIFKFIVQIVLGTIFSFCYLQVNFIFISRTFTLFTTPSLAT